MDVTDLYQRIERWEDLHTDFKERIESVSGLARDIVCFASTDGGQIVIGVAKDRTVVGVVDPDAAAKDVDNAPPKICRDCAPGPTCHLTAGS